MRAGDIRAGVAGVVFVAAVASAILLSCSSAPTRPNIVIVVLDTVRSDYIGRGGPDAPPTPAFDAIAEEGTSFTRAWSNAPWTAPSHASMFSGLLPSSHGCTGRNFRFESREPTFAELVGQSGYQTAAFYSNPWLSDGLTGVLRGFEEKYEESGTGMEILMLVDQGGARTVANVSSWLDERQDRRPFLLFVNLLEPHLPFHPPDDYRREYLPDIPLDYVVTTSMAHEFNAGLLDSAAIDFGRVGRLYGGDVNTADRYLGELMRQLKEHGLYEDAVIIVTSDHGENLGDYGYMDHQFGVFPTLIDVPLVVRAPALLPPGERDDPVMLTDVYDTVLDVAGIDNGPDTPHSRSLLDAPADPARPQIAEYTGANPELVKHLRSLNPAHDTTRQELAYAKVRVDSFEYTVASDGFDELYNLNSDPSREFNIAAANPAVVGALVELLPTARFEEGADVEIDEEMRAWLRSLGYIR